MSLTEAVEAMKLGRLARPIAWHGSSQWVFYNHRTDVQAFGAARFLTFFHRQDPIIFNEDLLGEWELPPWEPKEPLDKVP